MSQDEERIIAGRYRILAELGAGTYGVVYRAYDSVLDNTVAIKMLKMQDSDPAQLVRFQKEAQAIARLKHENIIDIKDFNLDSKNDLYIVLEYIEGYSLRELLDDVGALEFHEAAPIFFDVLSGLAHAHKNGIIHRDLNPSNILIDRSNPDKPVAKLVDFGLARTLSSTDQHLTRTGAGVGSPAYMSPEQCRAEAVDGRSDIYSFGCVMFQVLTGVLPYEADTVFDTIMLHINEDAPALSQVNQDIEFPEGLEQIVAKALKRDKEERYQTSDQLKQDLAAIDLAPAEQIDLFENERPPVDTITGICLTRAEKKRQLPVVPLAAGVFAIALGIPLLIALFSEKPVKDQKTSYSESVILAEPDGPKLEYNARDNCWVLSMCETDAAIARVKGRKDITRLNIRQAFQVSGQGLFHLKDLPLTMFKINSSMINDRNLLKYLPPMPNLEILEINLSEELQAHNIDRVCADMPELSRLALVQTKVDDDSLKSISRLRNLVMLNLRLCLFNGAGLHHLADLPYLSTLDLGYCSKIKPEHFSALEKLTRLNNLNLEATSIDRIGCRSIARLKNLSWLVLHRTGIDNQDFEIIMKGCPRLDHIYCNACANLDLHCLQSIPADRLVEFETDMALTGQAVETISAWKNLEVLKLRKCGLSEAQAELILSRLPKLRDFELLDDGINEATIRRLNSKFDAEVWNRDTVRTRKSFFQQ